MQDENNKKWYNLLFNAGRNWYGSVLSGTGVKLAPFKTAALYLT